MDSGWQRRLEILKRDAESKIMSKLRLHGWKSEVIEEVSKGDYIVIETSRNCYRHKIALLYSSSTSNDIYKILEKKVEHIFINGSLDSSKSFSYGIKIPISKAMNFQHTLLDWNSESSDGLFAPAAEEVADGDESDLSFTPNKYNMIQSENPLRTVWIHLRQLESVTLAKKNVCRRAEENSTFLKTNDIDSKGEGVAFTLRNASDYFKLADSQNISQRILNLYYGTLAFSFAEMLASPTGPNALSDIEKVTKQGHGLYTLDGKTDRLEDLVVGVIKDGFYPKYMNFLNLNTQSFASKRTRKFEDLKSEDPSWTTFENLISSIPDISDLFVNIFDSKPGWIIPSYDSEANVMNYGASSRRPTKTYAKFIDQSGRWEREDIVRLREPISEISQLATNNGHKTFRGLVDHKNHDHFWSVLSLHQSPYVRHAVIIPLFGEVKEFRVITLAILYSLSIVVRYRPSLWRRVQEGDLDYMRVLIEAYLDVVERVIPEQYLGQITGKIVLAKQPGSLF